jgi:hypothetical protein
MALNADKGNIYVATTQCCSSVQYLSFLSDMQAVCQVSASCPSLFVLLSEQMIKCFCCVQHLISAANHFRMALKADKGNIYAANGLGAVCAQMGQLDQARQIFSFLRESAATLAGFVRLPDVRAPVDSLHSLSELSCCLGMYLV